MKMTELLSLKVWKGIFSGVATLLFSKLPPSLEGFCLLGKQTGSSENCSSL